MRRTGNTTRAVDKAVQALFTYGRIVIPWTNEYGIPHGGEGYQEDQYIVDGGINTGLEVGNQEVNNSIQKHLRDRIIERVEREHSHMMVTKDSVGILTLVSKNFGR